MPSCKFVFVPADPSEPLQEWSLEFSEDKAVEALLDRVKAHFRRTKPPKTDAQRAAKRAALLAGVPEDARSALPVSLLDAASDMGVVENIALLSGGRDNGFISVNLYCDDEGGLVGAPRNVRACELAALAGKHLDVRGDAFLARVFDDEDNFQRLDLTLSDVSSSAPWVRAAAEQNARKAAGESAEARLRSMGVRAGAQGGSEGRGGGAAATAASQSLLPAPPKLEPEQEAALSAAEAAKAEGNARFAASDWAAAAALYSRAADAASAAGDAGESVRVAALNNRAAARLAAGDAEGAAADAGTVLAVQPRAVKAWLRRGAARERLGDTAGAADDFGAVLKLQPHNKQAEDALERLRQGGGGSSGGGVEGGGGGSGGGGVEGGAEGTGQAGAGGERGAGGA